MGQTLFCALVSVFSGSVPRYCLAVSSQVALDWGFADLQFCLPWCSEGSRRRVLTSLTERTHNTMAPAFYVVAAAAVSLVALGFVRQGESE